MSDTWWLDLGDLDPEQSDIIDLEVGKSYVIFGPPGSGKSNLLLLRANFLYLGGHPNIQIIVFTRTLQEFIASGSTVYDFPVDKLKTSTKFFQDLLYSYGVRIQLPTGFEELRKVLIDEVGKLIKTRKLQDVYDTILLDEAQDYLPEEIELFSQLSANLFAVADSRQKIYPGDDSIGAIRSVVDGERDLNFHYRIGRKICRVADALMKDSDLYTAMEPGSQYKENINPSDVQPFVHETIEGQVASILQSLKLQHTAYPNDLLGVLCPKHETVIEVGGLIRASEFADIVTVQGEADFITFPPEKRIVVCTIHAAKGLEFRAVHIPGADLLVKFRHQKNLAFTGITRAKTQVSIYHSKELPGYLAEAIQTVRGSKSLPEKRQIFGKKKK